MHTKTTNQQASNFPLQTAAILGKMATQRLNKNSTASSFKQDILPARLSLACVLGGGSYGTALAQVVARGGTQGMALEVTLRHC